MEHHLCKVWQKHYSPAEACKLLKGYKVAHLWTPEMRGKRLHVLKPMQRQHGIFFPSTQLSIKPGNESPQHLTCALPPDVATCYHESSFRWLISCQLGRG